MRLSREGGGTLSDGVIGGAPGEADGGSGADVDDESVVGDGGEGDFRGDFLGAEESGKDRFQERAGFGGEERLNGGSWNGRGFFEEEGEALAGAEVEFEIVESVTGFLEKAGVLSEIGHGLEESFLGAGAEAIDVEEDIGAQLLEFIGGEAGGLAQGGGLGGYTLHGLTDGGRFLAEILDGLNQVFHR